MIMSVNRVVALCEQAAYFLQEDLALIESGDLKLQLFGAEAHESEPLTPSGDPRWVQITLRLTQVRLARRICFPAVHFAAALNTGIRR